jgi:putative phosphoribosyl transferase
VFVNRVDAGRKLAARLTHLGGEDVVVLGLPRGGVPVGFEVAQALGAPLDVIVVRKLGVPYQPELAMGAIGEDGVRVVNADVVAMARVSEKDLAAVEGRERSELERRARLFRGDRPRISLEGRTAVIVDDGIATGSTARAAAQVARAHGAARVVVATPVAPSDVVMRLQPDADEVVVVWTPEPFYAIGQFYSDFNQVSDAEVVELLHRASPAEGAGSGVSTDPADDRRSTDEEVEVVSGGLRLRGHLTVPRPATGIVLFAHGSGSSRLSPRNQSVARVLNRAGVGTLLFDLLLPAEESDRSNVFDIALLADRLVGATAWLAERGETAGLPIGYFGASTGAAAALWASTEAGVDVAAIVSRGGRPDLAAARLGQVTAATLLIVGGHDLAVLEMNRSAQGRLLRCENRLEVVTGATHLFEEPGALGVVADLARDWFVAHFHPRVEKTTSGVLHKG